MCCAHFVEKWISSSVSQLTGSAYPFPCPALFQVIVSVQMAIEVISQ